MQLLTSRRGMSFVGLAIVALFAVLRIASAGAPLIPMLALRDALSLSTAILIESFPFIMLGILLSVVVRVWAPASLFARVTPKNPVARRVLMSFIGTLLPVCECGNVPLARALLRQGFNVGDVLAFTLSAPLLNPVTIVTTYQAFGSENGVLWGRVLGGFLIAQIVAVALTWKNTGIRGLSPALAEELEHECGQCCAAQKPSTADRMKESLLIFQKESAILLPPLIFGALIAGLIQVGISRDLLLTVGSDPVLSVLAMIALAFIVSICSSVDAFFALSLAGVFTPGALTAFLVFGAMVDVKMLMLLRTTYRGRTLVALVVLVTLLSAALGMGMNISGIGA